MGRVGRVFAWGSHLTVLLTTPILSCGDTKNDRKQTSLSAAPQEIIDLVERFHGQRAAYRSGHYNETQLRRDFLDPLFEALGWDMTNRKNYSERYREVIHEVSVEVEGQAKAADYCLPIRRQYPLFSGSQETGCQYRDQPRAGLSDPTLRLVRQDPRQHIERFRAAGGV